MQEERDPSTIEDEGIRTAFRSLMNLVESLSAKVAAQAKEIQQLRDENSRLKGEQGKPKIRPNAKERPSLSSEHERHEPKAHHKTHKQTHLHSERVEVCALDRATLPDDVQFKGYEEVVVQDLIIRPETIRFRKEKYYSKSQQRTYLAPLPAGYQGQFGPSVKAWALTLYYADGMSEPKILDFLQTAGMQMSAGQLSALLIKDQERFHEERADLLRAGLASTPYQHLDSTTTRLNGKQQQCHILCNPWYTVYQTWPAKDRMTILRVLEGGAEPVFSWNELAKTLLRTLKVSQYWCDRLPALLVPDQCYSEAHLDEVLRPHLPRGGEPLRRTIKEAMAIAHYRSQTTFPIVPLLVCDDASEFVHLTEHRALCWVHEYRHYKKLTPRFQAHIRLLEQFADAFWTFYRRVLAYRQAPCQEEAEALWSAFDTVFAPNQEYVQLEECLARTRGKKEALLQVLAHPELPLHNNPAELGARQRVRKRDVSLQARTTEGLAAWDTFQTLVETARKLGVNCFQYFSDRLTHRLELPSLAALIAQHAAALPLAGS